MIAKWLIVPCLLYIVDQASTLDSIVKETLKRHQRSNGARSGLNADGPQFLLDGKPFTILSGAIHYFRVPRAYWWDRLASLKSAGLNTVETYVPWNVHEEYEGQFDYSGEYDLVEFINTAKQVDLFVIVRPGPYICAEWEFGGLPAWLLSDASMSVRTEHRGFMVAAERYLNNLLPRLSPHQYSRGGPIIAFQIENEYQTYGNDLDYMRSMRAIFDRNNVQELMFTSDGENLLNRMGSNPLPGILTAVNFQANPERALNILTAFQPGKPLFVGEFWSGWFDHWGEKHNTMNQATFAWLVDDILKRNASINFYMFHGGTNFGFWNGANGYHKDGESYPEYKPTETTYDYNAPLSEQGEADPKFFALQQLVKKYFPQTPIYSLRQKLRRPLGRVYASEFLLLTDVLDHVIPPMGQISTPVYVEYLCHLIGGQIRAEAPKASSKSKLKTKVPKLDLIFNDKNVKTNNKKPCKAPYYGFVAYRHDLTEIGRDTTITLSGVIGDRMQILVDGELINTIYSNRIQQPTTLKIPVKATSRDLILLVENMGRVGFIHLDQQRKGFNGWAINDATGVELSATWKVYNLGLKKEQIDMLKSSTNRRYWRNINQINFFNQPAFYSMKFTAPADVTDQFVNFESWDKGAMFVNNFNLGRYWKIGPQKALYLPAPYINQGENDLLLFELHKPTDWRVDFQDRPSLG